MTKNNIIFLLSFSIAIFMLVSILEVKQREDEIEFYKEALEETTGYKVTNNGYIMYLDNSGKQISIKSLSDSIRILNYTIEKQKVIIKNITDFANVDYSVTDSAGIVHTYMWNKNINIGDLKSK